ncbi:hypothetical protein EMIHUDRAFT_449780, partial [Emiliania huxleyi CCMP1516]|uniref:Uncharacterized protein n=2 Tax=Emiliania huxleyi TaxID=2903 RepID=A0A0D3K302_EMIH1
ALLRVSKDGFRAPPGRACVRDPRQHICREAVHVVRHPHLRQDWHRRGRKRIESAAERGRVLGTVFGCAPLPVCERRRVLLRWCDCAPRPGCLHLEPHLRSPHLPHRSPHEVHCAPDAHHLHLQDPRLSGAFTPQHEPPSLKDFCATVVQNGS